MRLAIIAATVRRRRATLVGVAALAVMSSAHADIATELNAVRLRGCESFRGAAHPLERSAQMDAVAREWSRGGRLHDAIARAQQRLTNSASLHARGSQDERVLVQTLIENNCESLTNPAFDAIGIHRQRDAVWVVLAERLRLPSVAQRAELPQRALRAVNAARAEARRCGATLHPSAPPLVWAEPLARAAQAHANDMAAHSRFDHVGSDGSRVTERVTRAAYRWRHVGENIAAGVGDVEAALAGWLNSPGHCANIMNPRFTAMGVAFAVDPASEAGVYWAQVFAAPR
jgi:uncharacterized protein YkwD